MPHQIFFGFARGRKLRHAGKVEKIFPFIKNKENIFLINQIFVQKFGNKCSLRLRRISNKKRYAESASFTMGG